MADVDFGQLANSLTSALGIFFQERRRQAGEVKADERFEKQQQLFLQGRELDREREDRLRTASEANIANQKADRKRARMAMFVNIFQESGFEIGMKVAKAMGATPEELQSFSTLMGIKAASRAPISMTAAFQGAINLGGTFSQAVEASNNPQAFDDSTLPGKRTAANPLNRDIIELVKAGTITETEAPILDAFFDQETDDLSIEESALIPGILAKIREGVGQQGIVPTERVGKLLTVQKKIADLELSGGDTSVLIVIENRLKDEIADISSGLMTDEERVMLGQEQATMAKESEAAEQLHKTRTKVRALEPEIPLAIESRAARERIGQGQITIKDLSKALIGTPLASVGSAIDRLFLPQAFQDIQTGQIIQVRDDKNLEVLLKAEKAGLIRAIPRNEAAALLAREGAQRISSPGLTLDDFRGSAIGGRR